MGKKKHILNKKLKILLISFILMGILLSILGLAGCFKVYPQAEKIIEGQNIDNGEPPPGEPLHEEPNEPPPGEPPHEDPEPEQQNKNEPPPEEPKPEEPKKEEPKQQPQTTATTTTNPPQQPNQGSGQFSTDVAITDIYMGSQPHGQFHVNITNNGPGTLNNVAIKISTDGQYANKNNPLVFFNIQTVWVTVTLNSKPGETQSFPTGCSFDYATFNYFPICKTHPEFADPNVSNNMCVEWFQ